MLIYCVKWLTKDGGFIAICPFKNIEDALRDIEVLQSFGYDCETYVTYYKG